MIELALAVLSWFALRIAQLFAARFGVLHSIFRTVSAVLVLPGTFYPRVQIAVARVRP